MKAVIKIELGNSAFGNNDAERLFEMRNVIERLMDNADRIMAADVGDFTTAQDTGKITQKNIAAAISGLTLKS